MGFPERWDRHHPMTIIIARNCRLDKLSLASRLPESFEVVPAMLHRIKVVILAIEPERRLGKPSALLEERLIDRVSRCRSLPLSIHPQS